MKWIGIDTRRYSTVIKAFLAKYPNAIVYLNKKRETRPTSEWCTNGTLTSIIDFSLSLNDHVILSFHDHPSDLIAPEDQLGFVQELEVRKVLRYRMMKEAPSLIQRLFGRNR
jgi:hypothetical protein